MKIVLAEDQPLILESLKLLIAGENDIEVAAVASDGEEALRVCRREVPDVAVLDIRMPRMTGLEVAGKIREEKINTAVLLLTTFEDPEVISRALSLGVEGFLMKDVEPVMFGCALRAVAGGLTVFHPAVKPYLAGKIPSDIGKNRPVPYSLTGKDLLVIGDIVKGLGNKEIAGRMGCSEGTVKNRVSSILGKMGLTARTQIAVTALMEDIV